MTVSKKVLKNFSFLLGADLAAKVLVFVSVVYLARILTVEGFGKIEFAQAIIVYFILLANQGLDLWGTREVAREEGRKKEIADNILSLRFFLFFLAYGILVLFVLLLNKPADIKKLILLYGLTIFTFSLTINWFFQGIERMEIIALGRLINQLFYVCGVLLIVTNTTQIFHVPVIKFFGGLLSLSLLAYLFFKSEGMPKIRFDISLWKKTLKQSLPMGFSLILIQIYYNLDTIMLGFIKGEKEVGWYNAAYKIILLFIGFASLFGNALFPVLSRYYKESRDKLRTIITESSRITLFFGIPISVGICFLSKEIMQIVYGSMYLKGAVALQILVWSVFTIYFNAPFGFLLLATERQKKYMYAVGLGALVNLILNLILIPRYGLMGASISTIICEIIVLSLILYYSRELVKVPLSGYLTKGFVSSFLMGLFIYLFPFNLFMKIFVGGVCYLICMFFLGGVSRKDAKSAYEFLRNSYQEKKIGKN